MSVLSAQPLLLWAAGECSMAEGRWADSQWVWLGSLHGILGSSVLPWVLSTPGYPKQLLPAGRDGTLH